MSTTQIASVPHLNLNFAWTNFYIIHLKKKILSLIRNLLHLGQIAPGSGNMGALVTFQNASIC